MAKISKPPVPAKLYKHFAVVTVVLTATIALFADGESREAVVSHIDQHDEQAGVERASQEVTGPPRLIRSEATLQGSFDGGGEFDSSFGQPMDSVGVSANFSNAPRSTHLARRALPNMTPEEVAELSQEEYERLLRLYADAGVIEDVDRSAQMSEIEAASARRMGHGGSDS